MKVVTRTMEINRRVSLRLKEQKRRSSTPLVTYPSCRLVLSKLRLKRWQHFQDVKETTLTKNSLDELKKTTSSCSARKSSSKETKSNYLAENSSKEINSCTTNKKDSFKEATPTSLVENSSFKDITSISLIEKSSQNKTTPTTSSSKLSSCKETESDSFKSLRPKRKKSLNHELSPIKKKLRLFPPTMEKMLDQNETFRECEDKCKSRLSNERRVKRSRQASAKNNEKASVV